MSKYRSSLLFFVGSFVTCSFDINNKVPNPMPEERGLREHIYHFIDNEEEQSFGSQSFELFITGLILLSIVSIVLESFEDLRLQYGYYFNVFENLTLAIFGVEYVLRVSTADYKYKDIDSLPAAAWRFMTSGSGIVDLIAVAPIFFHFASFVGLREFAQSDFRFIRILKITRLLRIFKMNSFTNSITVVAEVFTEKRHDLGITLFVTFVLLLVSSTLMWYVEGPVQKELFPNILASFWWAIATLTTVGYGDVFPITPLGKFLSGLIALLGIGLVALPAGILSSAFIEKLEDGTIKEEEIENYVPKGNLPQAQFQKINTKKTEGTSSSTEEPIYEQVEGHANCGKYFGQAFIYCPYCGEKLSEDDNHKHV